MQACVLHVCCDIEKGKKAKKKQKKFLFIWKPGGRGKKERREAEVVGLWFTIRDKRCGSEETDFPSDRVLGFSCRRIGLSKQIIFGISRFVNCRREKR